MSSVLPRRCSEDLPLVLPGASHRRHARPRRSARSAGVRTGGDLQHGNPQVFHFHLHAVPTLPERLVASRERIHIEWFLDLLADDASRISESCCDSFAEEYRSHEALNAGLDWYRTLPDRRLTRH